MNYYVLNYKYRATKNVINYGDNLQSISVIKLLNKFSINNNNIDFITRDQMGLLEKNRKKGLFIPSTGGISWNSYPNYNDLPINDHNIRILYFGVRIPEGSYDVIKKSQKIINSFKKYEPIGCRDIATLDFLRSFGIKSFYSKCVTLTLDKRKNNKNYNKEIFIISEDKKKEYQKVIPPHIWKNHRNFQVILDSPSKGPMTDKDAFKVNNEAIKRFEYLKKHASLVISSRIHVVMPCIAFGIPTIFVDLYPEYSRTSVVRSLMPSYKIQDLSKVNWDNVKPTNINKEKTLIKLLFAFRLQQEEHKLNYKSKRLNDEDFKKASEILEKMCVKNYTKKFYKPTIYSQSLLIKTLLGNKEKQVLNAKREIIIFGAGDLGFRILNILRKSKVNPSYFCDNNSEDIPHFFNNIKVISFKELKNIGKDSFIIIAVHPQQNIIKKQLNENGFKDNLVISSINYCKNFIEYIPEIVS